ncbi:hypothetical protein AXJ18_gp106 [Streptomyces phage Jay2Jay]|uniref:Uncharacterized protein n=1 Tax=Streptomyces phage Jay2Jay TaxID=1556290 RepID=A0A0A0RLE8_9CAUD|nr:hypothetical protein AXJ18_gp106 [Streptomyces phage Jay2Jay]AIW02668.1 hypothetical protein PBI_JAY2JAY_214 [Streptomyces phage Jay2Jay]
MSHSNYMEDGVCGLCLLVELTEELGLYENQGGVNEEEVDSARNEIDGPSVHEGP